MRPALCADLALTNPRTPSPPPPPPPPPCRRRRPGSGASRLEPRRFTRVVFNYLFFSVSRVTPRHQVIMSLHGARSSAAACSLASLWPGPPAAAIFPLAPNAETPTRGARPAVRARCVPVSPRTIFRGRALHAFTLGPPLTPSRALLTGVCVSSQALQRRAAHACPVSRSRNASNGSTWYTGYSTVGRTGICPRSRGQKVVSGYPRNIGSRMSCRKLSRSAAPASGAPGSPREGV